MKILLVDDHALFLEGIKNLLTARGVQVVGVARDGLEGVGSDAHPAPGCHLDGYSNAALRWAGRHPFD